MSKTRTTRGQSQGAVYKIKCCDCQTTYIGETGRNNKHKWAMRNGDINNHIAEYHLQIKHQIDWDSVTCIMYSTDYYQWLALESWFTNLEQTPLNRTQQLLALYKWLIDEIKQNYERTTRELTIWLTIDNCLTVTRDGSKHTNITLRVFIAYNIMAKLTDDQ